MVWQPGLAYWVSPRRADWRREWFRRNYRCTSQLLSLAPFPTPFPIRDGAADGDTFRFSHGVGDQDVC